MHIVSASRRTDLIGWYSEFTRDILTKRYPPQRVHTIVIMTKFPSHILNRPLLDTLRLYENIIIHCTITGLGGTAVEPGAPTPEQTLPTLPSIIDFAGSSANVAVRIDPIVRIQLPDRVIDNSDPEHLMTTIARYGCTRVISSFVTPYPKAKRRLAAIGASFIPFSVQERKSISMNIKSIAQRLGIHLQGCCTPEFPPGACIDPALLTRTHPQNITPDATRAAGQRSTCLCCKSVDIAWYASHPCYTGCLYCYANPRPPITVSLLPSRTSVRVP